MAEWGDTRAVVTRWGCAAKARRSGEVCGTWSWPDSGGGGGRGTEDGRGGGGGGGGGSAETYSCDEDMGGGGQARWEQEGGRPKPQRLQQRVGRIQSERKANPTGEGRGWPSTGRARACSGELHRQRLWSPWPGQGVPACPTPRRELRLAGQLPSPLVRTSWHAAARSRSGAAAGG